MDRVSGWVMRVFGVHQLSLLYTWAVRRRSFRIEFLGDSAEISDFETGRGID